MTTTTDFILEVQEKGSEKIEDVREKVEDLTQAQKANAASSDKMAGGMDKVERKTRLATKAVDKLKSGYEKLGSVQGIVMALAGAAIVSYAAKIADAASTLNGFSDELGIDVQKLQVYSDVATLAGSSIEGVASAIKGINQAIKESSGNEKIAQIFKDLNINIKEFEKLKPEDKIEKLSKAIQGYSIAEQDYIIKSLKAEGLQKVLKSPDEVSARGNYLRQNGLIVNKDEVSTLNEFTDLWTNLMTDITNFSTITLGNFAKGLKDIFNLEPSEKNTILNRKSAEQTASFAVRFTAVMNLFAKVIAYATSGLDALVNKGTYVLQVLGVQLDLLDLKGIRFVDNLRAFFDNYSFNEFTAEAEKSFDDIINNMMIQTGKMRSFLGDVFGSDSLKKQGEQITAEAEANISQSRLNINKEFETDQQKRKDEYNKNQTKYLSEFAVLQRKIATINNVNDKKSAELNKAIAEAGKEIYTAYDKILYAGKGRVEQEKEISTETTKTLTNIEETKKYIAEINSLQSLQVQLLQSQGMAMEANELQRKIAIEKLDDTFKDVKNKAEATDIVNALFDNNKLKIKLDDITKELDELTTTQAGLTPFDENWNSIADEISQKTKEQIELQKELKIAVKDANDSNLLSLENLKAGNQAIASELKSSLKDYITGAKTATEAISGFFEGLAEKLLDAILNQLILNAVTAAFGGTSSGAASGSSGILTSIAGLFGGSKKSSAGSAGTASSRHNGLAGGEITQGTLIKPDGYNFSHDEGFIVAKAGESVGTKQDLEGMAGGSGNQTINNNIMIDGDSLTDKLFKTQTMDRNLDNYFKKNGPLLKTYFK